MPTTILALMTLAAAIAADRARGRECYAWPTTLGLTDAELWSLIASGEDPLHSMGFEDAVARDPRRIFGLVQQAIFQGMSRAAGAIGGGDPMSDRLNEAMYLMGMDLVRKTYMGDTPVAGLSRLLEESWANMLEVTARSWPSFVREAFAARWKTISGGFERARDVVERARTASRRVASKDGPDWIVVGEILGDMEESLKGLLMTGLLPSGGSILEPIGVGRALRMLPGPDEGEPEA